jgi:hypothetical protein
MKALPIKSEIDAYCHAAGLRPSTVCHRAVANGHLYKRLEAGGECLPRTVEKVRAYMRANPPAASKAEAQSA